MEAYMGWSWKTHRELLLQYPGLADIQSLVDRWPSLAALREKMQMSGELKSAKGGVMGEKEPPKNPMDYDASH